MSAPAGTPASHLEVLRSGRGPRVLLVHGSVVGAARTWRHQQPLARRWSLEMPNRPGFGGSPEDGGGDFEAEARAIAELLGEGAHLVGHSYGAVIALFAAAARPDAVHSLTVSEPGCMGIAAAHAHVAQQIAAGELLFGRAEQMQPLEFLRAFRGGVGSTAATPRELDDELLRGARLLMRERPPWRADPPLAALRAAPFAKLVVSGAHSTVFETVCDVLAERIGAERAQVSGRRHTIPATGAPYNETLERFLLRAQER